ncbi:hypothetical protein QZH41_015341 [Actinostola sp. cb2023]|nr:hypothetical protein QZH41_015341 [Actinostola sp. cb2023]
MDSDHPDCTVNVSGLTAFNIGHFETGQPSVQDKTGFEGAITPVTCFNEVVASQDGGMTRTRNVQLPVDVVSYDGTTNMVTAAGQDNLLSNTQVTVLNVPENSIFEVVQTVSQGEVSVADIHMNICGDSNTHQPQEQSQEPKATKRKGGWPKGKKRKKEMQDLNKPKAPVTGYVRFLNSRRDELKQLHPHLSFPEITKMLGLEWNTVLRPEEKQKFLDEAENDKKRYIEELKAYQQSEKYQAFVKRQEAKRVKPVEVGETDHSNGHTTLLITQAQEDTDSNELFCKTCDQHFSSLHNKKEHMYGRQHLQMLTCEFERETEASTKVTSSFTCTPSITSTVTNSPVSCQSSLTIPQFTETFLEQNLNRELEIRELRKSILSLQERNVILAKQYEELKGVLEKSEHDMTSHKTVGASLTTQLNTLRMVPTLFGVQLLNLQS